MRESIRRRPFVCSSSCARFTYEMSSKNASSPLLSTNDTKIENRKIKQPSKICFKKANEKHKIYGKNQSDTFQQNAISNCNEDDNLNNTSPDENNKSEYPPESICCSMFQPEHCNDSFTDQTIFYNLLSKLEEHLDEERKTNAKLQVELMNKTEYENQITNLRSSYEAEVFRLQNIITRLQGSSHCIIKKDHDDEKLTDSNPETKEIVSTMNHSKDESSTDKNQSTHNFISFDELKKEYDKQESLIIGYQRENEKLYEEIKKLHKSNPTETEDSQTAKRLTTENLSLRIENEQLNKELKLRSQQISTMLSRNSRLNQENQINELQESNKQLENEKIKLMKELNDTNSELMNINSKMNTCLREKNDLLEKYETFKDKSQIDYANMREQYQCQIEELQKKLRWYIENQSFINKDTKLLQSQARELEKLHMELSHLKSKYVSGSKSNESKQSCDNKCSNDKQHEFLLERIKFLESELDRTHENEKRAIRSLQQQYERVKLQYEDRIQSLESYTNTCNTSNELYTTSLQQYHTVELDTLNNQSIPNSNKQLKQSNNLQSNIISNLLNNLRGQITHLKQQLNQRHKTIEQMKYFTQLNSNDLNKTFNQFNRNNLTMPIINKRFHHPRVYEVQSRQINRINDQTKLNHKVVNSKQQNKENMFMNDTDVISMKEHNTLKTSLQNRINELENVMKLQESLNSQSKCEASTNTDFNEMNTYQTNDTYIDMLEKQIKNQIDTIVSKETELNQLKKLVTNRNESHYQLDNIMNRRKYNLNTSQYTEEDSEIKAKADVDDIDECMNEICTNVNPEADYWRHIAMRLINEFNSLQNDANLLVNILTQLQ
ncbi:Centrosomal protein [Schistosoma japonicum]|uniref:Centrosomal protein of 162 kDa n=1 Tax=Schistosoma japonicum TaxID=6182 RepID=A0A4Z2DC14_SCHJA|nr:Centrosomal protein [Schistosoma japonicum]TNN13986.1 Centrosomal protein [Schistosoma japonicum]